MPGKACEYVLQLRCFLGFIEREQKISSFKTEIFEIQISDPQQGRKGKIYK